MWLALTAAVAAVSVATVNLVPLASSQPRLASFGAPALLGGPVTPPGGSAFHPDAVAPPQVPGASPIAPPATDPKPSDAASSLGVNNGVANQATPAAGLVEDISKRTVDSKTFKMSGPQHYLTQVYGAPVHFKGASGAWEDIDPTLTPRGGRVSAKANSFGVDVAARANDTDLVRVSLDASHQISWSVDAAGPAAASPPTTQANVKVDTPPALRPSTLSYAGIAPGVSLQVTSAATEASTDLILASRRVPTVYRFSLHLNGLTASLDSASGDVLYADETGTIRARTNPAFMTDSKIDRHTGTGATSKLSYALVADNGGTALQVSLDPAWLADPARVFPVTVDPNIQPQAAGDDTYVNSGFTNDNSGAPTLNVGSYDAAHANRAFLHFPGLDSLNGDIINSAQFYLYNNHSWSCSPAQMDVWRVTSVWNGPAVNSFATPPSPQVDPANPINRSSFAYGYDSSCPARYAVLDATAAVQNWTNGTWANDGIALVSTAPESNVFGYKSFNSENSGLNVPLINVDYVVPTPPSAPLNVTAAAGDASATIAWSPPASAGARMGSTAIRCNRPT